MKLVSSAIIALLLFAAPKSLAQNIMTVTDCNLHGWLKQPIGNSSLEFVNGPSTPPLGRGSLKFNVPEGGIFWPGDFVRFRNGQYSGTLLSSLTELSYSTYVESRDTIADIHFLVILSDVNGDGSAEHNLVFDPRYQNPRFIRSTMPNQGETSERLWQSWDALHGGWFFGGTPETDPDHNGPFFTLAEYISQYPNATIRNDAAKGGPAIRLSAGGVVFKPNFFGSIDNFKIGVNGATTTYDFEFSISNAGADKIVVFGYGSNCVTLNGSAAGGVAPYTYLWSPGGSAPGSATTQVCPATTTAYTLAVTDANGCSRSDEVTVYVKDVRCGSQKDKVKICHSNQELCVATPSVQAHLDHGDKLGGCSSSASTTQANNQPQQYLSAPIQLSNYPNPYTNTTRIAYTLPSDGYVSIRVFDLLNREVTTLVNAYQSAGRYNIDFMPKHLSPGVYHYKLVLSSDNKTFMQTNKMLISQ